MAFLDLLDKYLAPFDPETREILRTVILEEQRFADMDRPNVKPRIREIIDESVSRAVAEDRR